MTKVENQLIGTLSEYLDWIKDVQCIKKTSVSSLSSDIYFRGQENSTWEIIPSVLRKDENGNFENECDLLRCAHQYLYSDLSNCRDELEKMILLQHYGLHTRLLDVTKNPLVALYFACQPYLDKDGKEKGGRVFCDSFVLDYNSPKIAKLIAMLSFDRDYSNDFNEYTLQHFVKKAEYTTCIETLKSDLSTPCFFIPAYNNKRIIAQQGAFLIAPFYQHIGADNSTYSYVRLQECDFREYGLFNKSVLIKSNMKPLILEELERVGINISTIFPDIEYMTKYLNQKNKTNIKLA